MESSLVQVIAPLGCYSSGSGTGTIQRDTQSYIRSSILPGMVERKQIVRHILSSRRDDKYVRAAVECYFYRTSRVNEWHVLRDEQKAARVSEFISTVWAAAHSVSNLIGQTGVEA